MTVKIKKEGVKIKYQFPKDFHVEIDRRGECVAVCVFGVISIIQLDDKKCVFKVRRGALSVNGNNLMVSAFENSIIEVVGDVEGVSFI